LQRTEGEDGEWHVGGIRMDRGRRGRIWMEAGFVGDELISGLGLWGRLGGRGRASIV